MILAVAKLFAVAVVAPVVVTVWYVTGATFGMATLARLIRRTVRKGGDRLIQR